MSHSRILIVRHGETNENVQGIVQGQLDTMLNEIGYEQAHKTGMALRHEPLSRIITSPLKRTLHTAEAIASFHPGIQVELDARLKERYFGEIEGRAFESPAHWPAHAEGMEPRDQLRDRLASMWEDLKRDAQARPSIIVLVSHGGAISSLIHHVIVRSPRRSRTQGGQCRRKFYRIVYTYTHLADRRCRLSRVWSALSHRISSSSVGTQS